MCMIINYATLHHGPNQEERLKKKTPQKIINVLLPTVLFAAIFREYPSIQSMYFGEIHCVNFYATLTPHIRPPDKVVTSIRQQHAIHKMNIILCFHLVNCSRLLE